MVDAVPHFREKVQNDEPLELNKQEAMEQLQYDYDYDYHNLWFKVQSNEELGHETRGDGIVDAMVGDEYIDHYIYYEE